MKKALIISAILVTVAVAPLFAQQYTILEIEDSIVMGYNLGTESVTTANRIGINFNFSNTLDAGFMFQTGAKYLVLKYTVTDRVNINLLMGSTGTNPSTGIQIGMKLLGNSVQGIISALRLNVEYLVPNISNGAINDGIFGASLGLGFGI